ncbi:rod shape-determining protein MreC [Tissierella sp. MSJ-40]|uniref:Cell shape-determining protein MreC n=1 Tax=Tissierella simiarum TaxID=2841534 RepID=A0ABS6EB89_9FIRM|nr:rod shape-determining protein MreC [Tissierella simiarum]MBU5440029.1 rod shape-determining protein MreC [Tissierella simiarum]
MSFFKKYRDRMVVTSVAIILIIIIGATSSERMALTKFEKIIGNMLSPIEKIVYNAGKKVTDFFETIKNISKLKRENEELKKKITQLERDNRKYEDIIGKTDYLKNEAKLMEETNYNLITSQIIGKEPGNWYDRFTIDKGLKDGVKKGATVIQGVEIDQNVFQEGIVGRVIDVGDNWAKVVTIIDEISNISFKIIRTQDGGVLSGSIDGQISGYLFDSKADVIKGDKLYTSGLGGAFVKDLYIGEVSEVVKHDEDLIKRITINPAINFKKLYRVYVISD